MYPDCRVTDEDELDCPSTRELLEQINDLDPDRMLIDSKEKQNGPDNQHKVRPQ